MLEKLAGNLNVVDDAERERDELLSKDAQSLLDKLRDGRDAVLSSFGLRARALDEKIAATRHQAVIVEKTIVAIGEERERIAERIEELDAQAEFLVADAVREALESELTDYVTTLENLRSGLVHLTALERVLGPVRHEYEPNARVVVVVPDFSGERSEQVVMAPEREIAKAESVIRQFRAALSQDARAPAPTFALIDANEDPSVPYHSRSAPERLEIARAFVPPVNTHRQTVDSKLFAEQEREMAARFSAVTNS
jgi:hypothetical protein